MRKCSEQTLEINVIKLITALIRTIKFPNLKLSHTTFRLDMGSVVLSTNQINLKQI